MRRALLLVFLVVLVTAGAWWLLPSGAETRTVIYLQTGTEQMLAPVFCEQNRWRLSLERITLGADTSRGLALFSSAKATFITLLLEAPSQSEAAAPPLSVSLRDDLGREYTSEMVLDCADSTSPDRSAWRFQLRFPPIDRRAGSITVLANTVEASFHLTGLPLP